MNSFSCPECGEIRPPFSKSCTACGSTATPARAAKHAAYPDYITSKPKLSYRELWYLDRGLPYEPPVVGGLPPPRGVARAPAVIREPGEDWDEVAG